MKATLLFVLILAFAMASAIGPRIGASSSARSGPSPTPSPTVADLESIKEFLMTSAATDFTEHQPPYPARFRNVKIGHMGDTSKSGAWRMCGEFLPTDGDEIGEWIGFVTVKTSGYEQYIGTDSHFCTSPKVVWDTTDDLAPLLKKKLDSLKKEK